MSPSVDELQVQVDRLREVVLQLGRENDVLRSERDSFIHEIDMLNVALGRKPSLRRPAGP